MTNGKARSEPEPEDSESHSSGVDVAANEVSVGRDIIGRDNITHSFATNSE